MGKILFFVFAGGNKYSFSKYSNKLSQFVVIEYQRKGMVAYEQFQYNIHLFVDKLLPRIKYEIDNTNDYIISGHSMGALIAYLVCHKIKDLGLKCPKRLIVSGRKAPSIINDKKISNLQDKEFWNEIVNLGGIPNEISNYPELIEYYIPILRHDIRLIESFEYERKNKLNLPIDVFYGSEEAEDNEMVGWRHETTGEVKITKLSGNHFFIFDHINFFINYFENLLKEATC